MWFNRLVQFRKAHTLFQQLHQQQAVRVCKDSGIAKIVCFNNQTMVLQKFTGAVLSGAGDKGAVLPLEHSSGTEQPLPFEQL